MEQIYLLKDKGIRVIELNNKRNDLIKRWGESFVKDIPKNQKRHIFYGRFMWHLFSSNVLSCKKKQSARKAFNRIMKDECCIFYQEFTNALLLENASGLTSEDIINEYEGYMCDVYVVDKDFTWTYIVTHEEDYGPYFYETVVDPIFFK
ncbi:DUF4275 family protein [Neobacillus massiliamazoniensis]|uniref:DUF4275 family protein n=1 Tax=Neobacillus massiliamazoniensis TaxID=1499688 RepID=A0A0U1P3K5_9BACI|nr:DUF4275 family protein [Neobacillus massiliamazoniensis]CRK84738.1 Hypothetical protein BN000_04787 [Neobacillus massiliamazoniensis]